MDIVDIIFELPEKLVELSKVLFDFMFTTITIGDIEISVWGIVGGVGLVAILLYSIIKN